MQQTLLRASRRMAEPNPPPGAAESKRALLRQAAAWLELPGGQWGEAVSDQLELLRAAVEAAQGDTGPALAAPMVEVLRALGRLRRQAVLRGTAFLSEPLGGVARLSAEWFDLADDGTAEFQLAAAVAAIDDPDLGSLALPGPSMADRASRACDPAAPVWHSPGVGASGLVGWWMAALSLRLVEGASRRLRRVPLASTRWASLSAVCAFLCRESDDRRIEELAWGLLGAKRPAPAAGRQRGKPAGAIPPRAYALLKLCFVPQPVGGGVWPGDPCPARTRILAALGQGDLFRACWLAAKELQALGVPAIARPEAGGARDAGWRDALLDPVRLGASLLVPISPEEAGYLVAYL